MGASYLRLARTSQRSGKNGDNGDEDVNNGDGSHDGHHGNNEHMKIIMNAHGSFLPEACENKTIYEYHLNIT